MRHLLTALVASTAMVGAFAAPTAQRQPVVPKQFRGEWNAKLSDCGTGMNDSRLVIRAGYIEFYESEGEILAVVTRGANELGVIAELSGEGDSWLAYSQFKLSEDGQALVNGADEATASKLRRCPVRKEK